MLILKSSKSWYKFGYTMKNKRLSTIVKYLKAALTPDSPESEEDNSVIDVTGQSGEIVHGYALHTYEGAIPPWKTGTPFTHSTIGSASDKQITFYRIFKSNFLKGRYFDLDGNINYALRLLLELSDEYDIHTGTGRRKFKHWAYIVEGCYPQTSKFVASLLEKSKPTKTANEKPERKKTDTYTGEYWKLGNAHGKRLQLSPREVSLLNKVLFQATSFTGIKPCLTEVMRLYLRVMTAWEAQYISQKTTLENEFRFVADLIARKGYRYKKGSINYLACVQDIMEKGMYTEIFRQCENAVRELHAYRGLTPNFKHKNQELKKEYAERITSRVSTFLANFSDSVILPDRDTEILLNEQFQKRWKIKIKLIFEQYAGNPKDFFDAIIELGELNARVLAVQDIFFEAAKFVAKHHRKTALILYAHYIYRAKSAPELKRKTLANTVQKQLFLIEEQQREFEEITTALAQDGDLPNALERIEKLYEVKVKKIRIDPEKLKEVKQQSAESAALLNKYLSDEPEEEAISAKPLPKKEEQLADTPKKTAQRTPTQENPQVQPTPFLHELSLEPLHVATLLLFSENNLSVPQKTLEDFAKSKAMFTNQLVDRINELCYELLDDVLIEQEDSCYTIFPKYFQKISVK